MAEEIVNNEKLPLIAHLIELRRRLIFCFIAFVLFSLISYVFVEPIYNFLISPLADTLKGENRRLIYTGLAEVFFTYMKLALFAGGVLSFPVIASQLWLFIAPGLYKSEKKFLFFILAVTPILFLAGAAFAYYAVIPAAWSFFAGFENMGSALPIQLEAKVDEYLALVMGLLFAFGISFQMPVILCLLGKAGVISSSSLVSKRRYAIVFIFIVAAILTPPDIVSQTLLAIPLIFLYESSVILVKVIEK